MHQRTVTVTTSGGTMATRTFVSELRRPSPVVIVYMDAFGVREALATIARRIAENGYFVALPDLFYRSAPVAPFDVATAFATPPERDRLMGLIRSLTPAGVVADTQALLDHLALDAAANAAAVGTVGYCMGGGYALRAAGTFPDRVACAASYHGGHLATDAPDSPHRVAARATGQLYIGYAENDRSFPEEQRERLEIALRDAGVRYTVEKYHAAHGFAVPDHSVYDERAATRHWDTLLALLGSALPTGRPSTGCCAPRTRG